MAPPEARASASGGRREMLGGGTGCGVEWEPGAYLANQIVSLSSTLERARLT